MKTFKHLLILSIFSSLLWSCSSHTEEEINTTINTADSLKSISDEYWTMITQNDSIIVSGMNEFLVYGKETGLDPMITQKLQVKISELEGLCYKAPTQIPSFEQVGLDDERIDLVLTDVFTYLTALPDSAARLSVLEFQQQVNTYYYEQLVGIRSAFSNSAKDYNDFIKTNEEVLDEGDYKLTPIQNFALILEEDETEEKLKEVQ